MQPSWRRFLELNINSSLLHPHSRNSVATNAQSSWRECQVYRAVAAGSGLGLVSCTPWSEGEVASLCFFFHHQGLWLIVLASCVSFLNLLTPNPSSRTQLSYRLPSCFFTPITHTHTHTHKLTLHPDLQLGALFPNLIVLSGCFTPVGPRVCLWHGGDLEFWRRAPATHCPAVLVEGEEEAGRWPLQGQLCLTAQGHWLPLLGLSWGCDSENWGSKQFWGRERWERGAQPFIQMSPRQAKNPGPTFLPLFLDQEGLLLESSIWTFWVVSLFNRQD